MQLDGSTLPIYFPPPADPSLQPADALLRESDAGQSQNSPSTQAAAIRAAMAQRGYYPSCIAGDERKGRVTTRPGYQLVRDRVAHGLTEAVFVFHSSRLGRDASERLALQRELKKLRVPIYSAQQGELRADLVGGVYALMDEQFSIDLAFKIKEAMPAAVKKGSYPVRTPIGYKRVWPADQPYKRKQAGLMVEDERYAPLVREIFERYAIAGQSVSAITRWLNTQLVTHPNPLNKQGLWGEKLIRHMLRCRVYIGEVEWGRSKTGYYDHYDGPVLRSGQGDCGPAKHKAIVDKDIWEAAQMRLETGDKRTWTATRKGRTPCLLSGFLACGACGKPVAALRERPSRGDSAQYVCSARHRCQSNCREPAISMTLADAAVLREVSRLGGRPWRAQLLDTALAADPAAAEREQTERALAAARRELDRNVRNLNLIPDPDEEMIASFRREGQAIGARIKALQAHLDELPKTTLDPIAVGELHARLAGADLAGLIANAQADGDVAALRELLQATVQSARITERIQRGTSNRALWVRAKVAWTPNVDALLEVGLLQLGPAPEPPTHLTSHERMLERSRRYRERKRSAAVEGA